MHLQIFSFSATSQPSLFLLAFNGKYYCETEEEPYKSVNGIWMTAKLNLDSYIVQSDMQANIPKEEFHHLKHT